MKHGLNTDKHAMVKREGFRVPLLGIPPSAVLQECDLCHDEFALRDVEICGSQVFCFRCRDNICVPSVKIRG